MSDEFPIINRIRKYREKRELSQRALAERLTERFGEPVHFTTISKLENGKMALTVDWAVKIGVVLEELTGNIMGLDEQDEQDSVPILKITSSPDWINQPAIALDAFWKPANAFLVQQRDIAHAPPEHTRSAYAPFSGMLVMIDPDYHSLIAGQYYLYRMPDGACRLGVFREGPPRMEAPLGWPPLEPVLFGKTTMEIIGWAIWREERLHDDSE